MFDAISRILAASNLTASPGSCHVVTATDGDIINLTPGSLLGSANLNVEVTIDAVEHLTAEVTRLDKESKESKAEGIALRKSVVAFARGPIRIVAAQVVQMVLGLMSLEQTHSTRVQSLPPDNPVIVKLAQMASEEPEELQAQLDKLITRSNNDRGHLTSLKALESEVQSLQDLFALPEIKQQYKWEALVIENYNDIKQAFPLQFQC